MKNTNATLIALERFGRIMLAACWFYQGLVPKLLFLHADELALSRAFGIPEIGLVPLAYIAGFCEIIMAILLIIFPYRSWLLYLGIVILILLLFGVMIFAPHYLIAAFNPVITNGAMIVLSWMLITLQRLIQSNTAEK